MSIYHSIGGNSDFGSLLRCLAGTTVDCTALIISSQPIPSCFPAQSFFFYFFFSRFLCFGHPAPKIVRLLSCCFSFLFFFLLSSLDSKTRPLRPLVVRLPLPPSQVALSSHRLRYIPRPTLPSPPSPPPPTHIQPCWPFALLLARPDASASGLLPARRSRSLCRCVELPRKKQDCASRSRPANTDVLGQILLG